MTPSLYYFAYGSNMSLARLQARTPSAHPLGRYILRQHDLRFHKAGDDGSAKCDACFTGDDNDAVYGGLFRINAAQQPALDQVEGVGNGYEVKEVMVIGVDGALVQAFTYWATRVDDTLKPYAWYVNHVLVGARERGLPECYISNKIMAVELVEDADRIRDADQWAVHGQRPAGGRDWRSSAAARSNRMGDHQSSTLCDR